MWSEFEGLLFWEKGFWKRIICYFWALTNDFYYCIDFELCCSWEMINNLFFFLYKCQKDSQQFSRHEKG